MAKITRFPLEMENKKTVTSIDELRNNFSLARVLDYAHDKRLIKWLRDRFENDIADAIEQVDLDAPDAAKLICEILSVPYSEDAEDEIEKSKERDRKRALLATHPECDEYASQVDRIAFDQDDLYNLLDENAEEIYLCGERFSVPVSKGNTKYIGITDNVIVVIESKKVIDFEEKAISFINCRFDDKYESLLNSPEKTELSVGKENNANKYGDLDQDELKAFTDDLREIITDFAEKDYENEDNELYEYDNSIECDASDYNDDNFATKAKAKAACKESISIMIKVTTALYEDAKDELIAATDAYYDDLMQEVMAFLPKFFESYDELLNVHCSGETKKKLKEELTESRKGQIARKWFTDVSNAFKEAFNGTVKEHFIIDKDAISEKRLFSLCDYNEEDDDDYSFSVDEAADTLVDAFEVNISVEEESFPEDILAKYKKLKLEFLSRIEQWVPVIGLSYSEDVLETITKTMKTEDSEPVSPLVKILRNSLTPKYKK